MSPFSSGAANNVHTLLGRLNVLEAAVGQAPVAVIILDARPGHGIGRQIVYVNNAFTRMTGYAREEAIGETLHFLKGPDTEQETLDRIAEAFTTGEPIHEEVLNYRKDGTAFWAECDLSYVKGDGGEITHWISIQRDITREKKAERALEEIARVQQQVSEVFFVVDRTWHLTFVNKQAAILFGGASDTLLGRNLWNVLQGRETALDRGALEAALREDVPAQFRGHDARLDQWFEIAAYPVEDGLSVRCVDISHRKVAEEALVESEYRFYHMADATAIMIWMSGINRGRTYFNRGWMEFTGRPLEKELGDGWLEDVHPEDRDHCIQTAHHAFDLQEPFHIEYRLRRQDGVYRWILDHGTPRFLPDEQFVGYIGSCVDITSHREAEMALKESAESYQGLLNSIAEAIFILDEAGHILDMNAGAETMYGYTHDELLESGFDVISAPGRNEHLQTDGYLQQAIAGIPQQFEWWARRKDGEVFPLDFLLNKGRYFGRDVVIATGRDVTARIQYEEQLIDARMRAEEMSRLKSSFLTNMSHEIRTPLTGIIGFSEILAEEVEGEYNQLAQMIMLSGRRLSDTLNSVLDLAQLESSTRELRMQPLDLRVEVNEVLDSFAADVARTGLQLRIHSENDPVIVRADRGAFVRALSNLLSNALKFTPEGEVVISIGVRNDCGEVHVRDTGVGISEDFLPHLFSEFRQESTGFDRQFEGTGLGLAITKRLVDLMEGEILVDTTKGRGSTFTIRLPLDDRTPAGQTMEEADPPEPRPARLLLVEDNEETRYLMEYLLSRYHTVDVATSAPEAIHALHSNPYDLIIIDINLGDTSGLSVLRALRSHPERRHTPAIACTAYALPEDEQRFLNQGFDAYLRKPFSGEQLEDTVRVMLEQ